MPTWLCQKQQVRGKDDVSKYPPRGGGESPVRSFPNFRGACFPSMATPGFQNSRLFGNRLLLGDRSQPPAAPPCGLSHGITRRGCSRGRVSVGEHARCRVAGRSFCGPRSLAEFPCLLVARVCARVLFLTDTSVHWNHEPAVWEAPSPTAQFDVFLSAAF